jgi:hypothetical protein
MVKGGRTQNAYAWRGGRDGGKGRERERRR